jgi:RNA polymerase sigma factor (sigma-70 family)
VADQPLGTLIRQLHRLAGHPPGDEDRDQDLLERFIDRKDEAAFTALLLRHGPMVRDVCHRVLDQDADVDDAFQATFLILFQQARRIRKRASVASWLHGVAYRTALRAREAGRRKPRRERSADRAGDDPGREAAWRELCALLDEEMQGLSETYRAPLVLCYFQGRTRDQAAVQLGLSLRTLERRLERGREVLRGRLGRRGVTLSAVLLATGMSQQSASARWSPALVAATVRAAKSLLAGGPGRTGHISGRVTALANAAAGAGRVLRFKMLATLLLAVGAAGTAGWLARLLPARAQDDSPAPQHAAAAAVKPGPAVPATYLRTDRYGDPLPPGVIARLGSVRMRHPMVVGWLAFTRRGNALLSGNVASIRLWDLKTGADIWRVQVQGQEIHAMDMTPDRKLVVTGHTDRMRWWDAATGKEVRRPGLPDMPATEVTISADGKVLVAADVAKRISVWDLVRGKALRQWTLNDSLQALACSPDGKRLAVEPWPPGTVRLYDATTGAELHRFRPAKQWAHPMAFSPDGKLLVTSGSEGSIRFWDAATAKEVGRIKADDRMVNGLTFSPDGKALATGGWDGTRLWDIQRRALLRFIPQQAGTSALAFSPDGRRLASDGDWCSIRLWDVATGKEQVTAAGPPTTVELVHFLPDGKTLLTTGGGQFRFWEASTGREIRCLDRPGEWNLGALSPDGKILASLHGYDWHIHLWDVVSGRELRRLTDQKYFLSAFSPDGRILATTGWPKGIQLWDVASGKELRRIEGQGAPGQPAFSPDGRRLVTSDRNATGMDFTVRMWDVSSGKEVWRVNTQPSQSQSAAYSPDGRVVAAVGWGREVGRAGVQGMVVLYNAATGKELRRCVGHTDGVHCATFSPDGRILATGGTDKTVRLWEVATGQERRKLIGHESEVWSLSLSPDGRLLASGGLDGLGLVWDLTGGTGNQGVLAGRLPAKELDAYWTDLAGADAARAYRAILTLAASPEAAVEFLRQELHPVVPADARRVTVLLTALDSKRFADRERAARELAGLDFAAEPALRRAWAATPSPEARRRIEGLLRRLEGPAMLRINRALEVLEHIATPEARAVVQALARGDAQARPTQEAQAVLTRLEARPGGR